jgi:PDZ domain-containing secreted protein
LKQGDVIRTYNGQTVDNADRFRSLVASTNPGTEVTLGILRDGQSQTIKVALGELFLDALFARDYPLIQATLFMVGALITAILS